MLKSIGYCRQKIYITKCDETLLQPHNQLVLEWRLLKVKILPQFIVISRS